MNDQKGKPQIVVARTANEAKTLLGGPDTPAAELVKPDADLSTPVKFVDRKAALLHEKRFGSSEPQSVDELASQVDLLNEQLALTVESRNRYMIALQEIMALRTQHTEGEAVKAIAKAALSPEMPVA